MRNYTQQLGGFILECYGSGIAYALIHCATNSQVWLQGDDATQFESDWESIEATFPHFTREQVARYLWDQYEYCVAAIELS